MTKCPNCGSSAQYRQSTPLYFEGGCWKYQKKCECGCIVTYIEHIERIEYPEKKEDE
jgi:hypothetical protein